MARKHTKSDVSNIYKSKHEFAWTETTIPEIEHKGRKLQNVPLVVPDGEGGYGDHESLALMTADQVEKHVNRAGGDAGTEAEKAYEGAREQLDVDFAQKRRAIAFEKWMNTHPAAVLTQQRDNTGQLVGMTVTIEKMDPETGATIVTEHPMTMDELEKLDNEMAAIPPGVV